jgi:hypothetical protein
MKNVFCDVTPCGLVRTDVLEELIASISRVERISELGTMLGVTSNCSMLQRILCSVPQLLVTAVAVPNSPIIVTLMMEALRSSDTRFLQEPHSVTSQKTTFLKQ